MLLLMLLSIHVFEFAPFKIPPSAALLETLNLNNPPLPLILHFSYGITWSVILVYLAQKHTSVAKGLFLALALWLFMMIVHSPVIGWGFFGFNSTYKEGSRLHLESGPIYLMITLVLHIIYGLIIGYLNPLWIDFDV